MSPTQQLILTIIGVFVAATVGTLIGGYLASKNNEKVSRDITGWDRKVSFFLKVKNEIFTPIYNDLLNLV